MGFLREVTAATGRSIGGSTHGRRSGGPARRRASLRAAIQSAGARGALVAEFKRNSPGRPDPTLPVRSVREFVATTAAAGVTGYSCVATEHRFGGSPRDVAELVAATDRPVLFKDFVLDVGQIEVAASVGASAVLLIARLEVEGLLRSPLAELANAAHAEGLEVLLEFHEKSELKRAADVPADMFGVNVRDLDTLHMEPSVAADTLRLASGFRPLLGLSGVGSASDARAFWDLGVDGILVGSALALSTDPTRFLHSLYRTAGVDA
jgi:indole-3-glycerol phosphate synthase